MDMATFGKRVPAVINQYERKNLTSNDAVTRRDAPNGRHLPKLSHVERLRQVRSLSIVLVKLVLLVG